MTCVRHVSAIIINNFDEMRRNSSTKEHYMEDIVQLF